MWIIPFVYLQYVTARKTAHTQHFIKFRLHETAILRPYVPEFLFYISET
jgi:hypothetical protein